MLNDVKFDDSQSALKKLLIVEDDLGLQTQLKWCLKDYEVLVAGNRSQAEVLVRKYEPQVVLLDLGLPPDEDGVTEGFACLQDLLSLLPHTKVIVVTGNEQRENAVKAVAAGAYDFYQKPIDAEILNLIVNRAFHVSELESENRSINVLKEYSPLDGIIASSKQMMDLCRKTEKIAATDITTLILGESGTGKELFARALHQLSPRSDGQFVAINCAAIPENLLESELFGFEKGAFTGAHRLTLGKVEYANGGTLFLDEIGDLPMPLQGKLLRFLQNRVIERLGSPQEIPIDVRVICATHQNIAQNVKLGLFREDLYYRISQVTLDIPPLRERECDVIILSQAFLRKFNKELQKNRRGFSESAIRALENHRWPGNVRELENRIRRAIIMSEGMLITAQDLELDPHAPTGGPINLRQVREEAEALALRRALAVCGGNISKTAHTLGVSRPTLYDLMNRYGLLKQRLKTE